MNKEQITAFIEGQLNMGNISTADLLKIVNNESSVKNTSPASDFVPNMPTSTNINKHESSRNLINTFYAIGAIIALVGVSILIADHWNEIGFAGRISVTLGISLATFIAGLLLNKPQQRAVSSVMFVIAAVLAPLGSYILLGQANLDFSWLNQCMVALILFIIFGTALRISKRNILALITIAFATWAYYAFIMKIFGVNYYDADFLKWGTMLLGISYIFIAYGYYSTQNTLNQNERDASKNILYGLGTLAVLGAGISFGGIFDLFFIAVIFAAFYGSVYLKSRPMLVFAALFLMAHIIKLTSKYFVGSISWPIALILVGFLVIGIGYMTFYLNKRFLSVS